MINSRSGLNRLMSAARRLSQLIPAAYRNDALNNQLNIPRSINSSPACIAPVIIGGLITMAISGVTSGISRFPGLIWVPTVVHAICVIMMIAGMLSHSHRFLDSLLVIICFGAVGLGVTSLIAWLSALIMYSIRDEFDADYIASIICKRLSL